MATCPAHVQMQPTHQQNALAPHVSLNPNLAHSRTLWHCLYPIFHSWLPSTCRGCVAPSALAWVRRMCEKLPTVPSLAFIHIPVPQFMEAWNEHATNGSKGEPVGCPLLDTRAFDVLRQVGQTQSGLACTWHSVEPGAKSQFLAPKKPKHAYACCKVLFKHSVRLHTGYQ